MHVHLPFAPLLVSFVFGGAASAAAREISGVIVDGSGRADTDCVEPLGYPALRRAVRAGLRIGF